MTTQAAEAEAEAEAATGWGLAQSGWVRAASTAAAESDRVLVLEVAASAPVDLEGVVAQV
jgi:hypothetical protein